MEPTLHAAATPSSPLTGALGLVQIMGALLAVLVFLLAMFETGRLVAGQLDTRGQTLAIMVCGMVMNAAWPRRCAWLRR